MKQISAAFCHHQQKSKMLCYPLLSEVKSGIIYVVMKCAAISAATERRRAFRGIETECTVDYAGYRSHSRAGYLFRLQCIQRTGHAQQLAEKGLRGCHVYQTHGHTAPAGSCGCGCRSDEGLGSFSRLHALYALVPADARGNRRKA